MSQVTDTEFMSVKNRKPEQLAFAWGEEGEALQPHVKGSRTPVAPRDNPSLVTDLMEQIVDYDNLSRALWRVRKNKGSAGIDGMTVDDLAGYFALNWPTVTDLLLNGRYQPKAVKRVDIPKSGGGTRTLGIPTVLDRLIQQAIAQILGPIYDPTFSDASFGFRPNKSAHQALQTARQHVEDGYGIVVDIDLEKFFDRVNHDKLMSILAQRINDKRLLKLIRRFLQAGMMFNGVVDERHEGTPQGGPLSPLLSNILLNELDIELTRRGHRFCRFADDCNVYVRSLRAGQRVMTSLTRWLGKYLFLRINAGKSGVARCHERKFLGMRIGRVRGKTTIIIATESLKRAKDKVRQITRRNRGISLKQMLDELNTAMIGWVNYYKIAAMKSHLQRLDEWIRHRIRCYIWKQWKTWGNRVNHLLSAGTEPKLAYGICKGWYGLWAASGSAPVNFALFNDKLAKLGLKSLLKRYESLQTH